MIFRVGRTYYTLPLRLLGAGVLGVALLAGVVTTFYTVEAESQGVVLRFGRYLKTVEPGLRMRLPFGIDRVYRVPVRRQLKQEFGFGTPGATNPYQFTDTREQELERSMVTGDLNAASVEWVVQYRIADPLAYLFAFRDPAHALRDLSESVMRAVIGDRTVDEVITVGRQEIEIEALDRLKRLVAQYGLGVSIDQIQLKNVNPPTPVQASFNEVNQAQQEREKVINLARGEYNKVVPRARGEAEGDAARFTALFTEYTKAPEVTRQRLYLETLEEVLPRLRGKIVVDEAARQVLPLLQLQPGKPTP